MLVLLQSHVVANKRNASKDKFGSSKPHVHPNVSTVVHTETSATSQQRINAVAPPETVVIAQGETTNVDRADGLLHLQLGVQVCLLLHGLYVQLGNMRIMLCKKGLNLTDPPGSKLSPWR